MTMTLNEFLESRLLQSNTPIYIQAYWEGCECLEDLYQDSNMNVAHHFLTEYGGAEIITLRPLNFELSIVIKLPAPKKGKP
jgi:hypothetical protein